MRPIILDLCGGSGAWSAPYAEAGYDVRIIDPRVGGGYVQDYDPPADVHGILAAPPCTVFAGSGARWKWTHHRSPLLMRQGYMTAYHCLRIIAEAQPTWWALENPVGSLRQRIGKWRYTFQPWEYGDSEVKRTCIWGDHVVPTRTPVAGPYTARVFRMAPSPERAALRSLTPPGFARAFFEANP